MQDHSKKTLGYKAPEFDDLIRRAIAKRDEQLRTLIEREERLRKVRMDEHLQEIKMHLSRMISIPVIIGIIAAVIFFYRFGWKTFEQSFLGTIMSGTVIASILALMERYGNLRI